MRSNIRNFAILVLMTMVIARIYYRATDDFRLSNISYDMPHEVDWEIPALSDHENKALDKIFNQKFTYLGKGAQSYAFVSEDDRYVVKFFKFKHLKPSWFIDNLPDFGPLKKFRELQQYKKRRKLLSVFNGYRLAYELHKSETGLLFAHLNKTQNLQKKIVVRDKIGFNRTINLDDVNFVVQEKVTPSKNVLNDFLLAGKIEDAKKYIHKLFDLYLLEYSKGIYDHDHGVLHNTGFIGERPIHLDVGKLYRDENIQKPEYAQKDLEVVAAKISLRLGEVFPEYLQEIDLDMQQYLKNAFDPECGYYQKCLR